MRLQAGTPKSMKIQRTSVNSMDIHGFCGHPWIPRLLVHRVVLFVHGAYRSSVFSDVCDGPRYQQALYYKVKVNSRSPET